MVFIIASQVITENLERRPLPAAQVLTNVPQRGLPVATLGKLPG